MAALAYVRRMRRMNLTGKATTAGQPATAASLGDGLGATWGLNWADKTFGQGLSSLTKGAQATHDCQAQHMSLINEVGSPSCITSAAWERQHAQRPSMLFQCVRDLGAARLAAPSCARRPWLHSGSAETAPLGQFWDTTAASVGQADNHGGRGAILAFQLSTAALQKAADEPSLAQTA